MDNNIIVVYYMQNDVERFVSRSTKRGKAITYCENIDEAQHYTYDEAMLVITDLHRNGHDPQGRIDFNAVREQWHGGESVPI